MRHLVWMLILLGGCSLKHADGASCSSAGDCASSQCIGDVCMGSTCECANGCPAGGEAGDGCVAGFHCIAVAGEPVYGLGSGDYCALACDASAAGSGGSGGCPVTFECSDAGLCEYVGPQLDIDYTPQQPRAHENVHLTAVLTPMKTATYAWTIDDGTMLTGAEIDHAFMPGATEIQLTATDSAGNVQDGNATITACPNTGDSCMFGAACCDGLTCNAQQVCQ